MAHDESQVALLSAVQVDAVVRVEPEALVVFTMEVVVVGDAAVLVSTVLGVTVSTGALVAVWGGDTRSLSAKVPELAAPVVARVVSPGRGDSVPTWPPHAASARTAARLARVIPRS
jgi:hypothetical protein